MNRIHYNPLAIRRVSSECTEEAEAVDTSRACMMEHMAPNEGAMRKAMDRNIISAQDCMKNTQNLLNTASDFMARLADYLEQQDEEIAHKMGV